MTTLDDAMAQGLTANQRVDMIWFHVYGDCEVTDLEFTKADLVQLLDAHARDAREQQRRQDLEFFLGRLKSAVEYVDQHHSPGDPYEWRACVNYVIESFDKKQEPA